MGSPRFVLTAAHCAYADNDFRISGFEYDYNAGRIHPNYDENGVSNDIALFELADDVPAYYATPVKLRKTPLTVAGTELTVIGFGDTNPSDSITDTSDFLRKVDVQYGKFNNADLSL